LVEEQRTNLFERSEEFDNAYWVKQNTAVTANQVIAPDGTLTGDAFYVVNLNTAQGIGNATTFTADGTSTYTGSIYIKKSGNVQYSLYFRGSLTSGTQYSVLTANTETGFVSFAAGGSTTFAYSVTDVGGWWRVSITAGGIPAGGMRFNVRLISQPVDTTLYIWGAQLEAGAFPTSYIKTEASQVTRSADAASMTGTNFSSWYNELNGTMYGEALKLAGSSGETNKTVFSINNNGTSNAARIGWNNTSTARFVVSSGGTANVDLFPTAPDGNRKIAATYAFNDAAISVNGGSVLTDTITNQPNVPTQANIGVSVGFGTAWNGTIKKIAYYPARLSNENLVALTS
jgi:hypothetical protein